MPKSYASSAPSNSSGARSQGLVLDRDDNGAYINQEPVLQRVKTFLFTLFYTLTRDKHDQHAPVAILGVVADFYQLLFMLLIPKYGWNIDPTFWLWRLLSLICLKNIVIEKGVVFYSILLYVFACLLLVTAAVCGYVFWKSHRSPIPYNPWVMRATRSLYSFLLVDLKPVVLTFLLVAVDCSIWGYPSGHSGYLDWFPQQACGGLSQSIRMTVAVLCIVYTCVVDLTLAFATLEHDLASTRLRGVLNSRVEVFAAFLKTLMVITTVMVGYTQRRVQAATMTVLVGVLLWIYFHQVPYISKKMNMIRCGLYASLLYAASLAIAVAFMHGPLDTMPYPTTPAQNAVTLALWVGLAPIALLGALIAWWRMRWVHNRAVAALMATPVDEIDGQSLVTWKGANEVEIVLKYARLGMPDGKLSLEQLQWLQKIIKDGMVCFPKSCRIHLLHANLILVQWENPMAGHGLVQAAGKLTDDNGWTEQYHIHCRGLQQREEAEELRLTKLAGGEGKYETSMDLSSFIEFTQSHRAVLKAHKAAFLKTKIFWRLLMVEGVSFTKLYRAMKEREIAINLAEAEYRVMLERYPNNVKLMKSYAAFLYKIKTDQVGYNRYTLEAQKLEDQVQDRHGAGDDDTEAVGVGSQSEGNKILTRVDDQNNAVVVADASGIIHMANKVMHEMFGYNRGELEGKNVSMLMPAPFSKRHNGYIQNYIQTGVPRIMDNVTNVLALHKDAYVFPVKLGVTKISGAGESSSFMAVFKSVPLDPKAVKVVVMPTGTIVSVDRHFSNWFGYTGQDVTGKHIEDIVAEEDKRMILNVLEQAIQYGGSQSKHTDLSVEAVRVQHKFFSAIPCNCSIELEGTRGQRLFAFAFHRAPSAAQDIRVLLAQDGAILAATSAFAETLGIPIEEIQNGGTNIIECITQPYAQLHECWIKGLDLDAPLPTPRTSCRSGVTVAMSVKTYTTTNTTVETLMPVKIKVDNVHHHLATRDAFDSDKGPCFEMTITPSSWESGIGEKRIDMELNGQGLITKVEDDAGHVFGFAPGKIVGQSLLSMVDPRSNEYPLPDISTILHRAMHHPGISWRVKVKLPATEEVVGGDDETITELVQALMQRQTYDAVLQVSVVPNGDRSLAIKASLWRDDMVFGVVQVDSSGVIKKLVQSPLLDAGVVFGIPSTVLPHKSITDLLMLNGEPVQSLFQTPDKPKRGGMKTNKAPKWGPPRVVPALHHDGAPLFVHVQAVPVDNGNIQIMCSLTPRQPQQEDHLAKLMPIAAESFIGDHADSAMPQNIRSSIGALEEGRATNSHDDGATSLLGIDLTTALKALVRRNSTVEFDKSVTKELMDNGGVPKVSTPTKAMVHNSGNGVAMDSVYSKMSATREGMTKKSTDMSAAETIENVAERINISVSVKAEEDGKMEGSKVKGPTSISDSTEDRIPENQQSSCLSASKTSNGGKKQTWQLESAANIPDIEASSQQRIAAWIQSIETNEAPNVPRRQSSPDMRLRPGVAIPPNLLDDGSDHEDDMNHGVLAKEAPMDASVDYMQDMAMTNDDASSQASGTSRKRRQKIYKLLHSPIALAATNQYKFTTLGVLCVLLLSHIICYVFITQLLTVQQRHVKYLNNAGDAATMIHLMALSARAVANLYMGMEVPGMYSKDDIPFYIEQINTASVGFVQLHNGVFLGFGKVERLPDKYDLYQTWTKPLLATQLVDVDPPYYESSNSSMWEIGNKLAYCAREVVQNHEKWHNMNISLDGRWEFRYMIDNAPWGLYDGYKSTLDALVEQAIDNTYTVNNFQFILLFVEAVGLYSIAFCVMAYFVNQAMRSRYELYSILTDIPQAVTRNLATQEIALEDCSDDDSLDGLTMQHQAATKKQINLVNQDPVSKKSIGGKQVRAQLRLPWHQRLRLWIHDKFNLSTNGTIAGTKKKKPMKRNARDPWWLLLPVVVWVGILVLLFFLSYMNLNNISAPVATLNVACFLRFRTIRTQHFIHEYCGSKDEYNTTKLKLDLLGRLRLIRNEYNSLVYGPETAGTTADPHFSRLQEGLAFASGRDAYLLFRSKDCLRYNSSTCLGRNDSRYELTHNGIHAMMSWYFDEIYQLLQENVSDITLNYSKCIDTWEVAINDLHDGVARLAESEYEMVRNVYDHVRVTHLIIFALAWVVMALYLLLLVRPFLKRASQERRQIVTLLMALPGYCDVEAMIRNKLGIGAPVSRQQGEGASASVRDGTAIDTTLVAGTSKGRLGSLRHRTTNVDSSVGALNI